MRVSIDNLDKVSAQQVFEHIAVHLLKQKQRSMNDDGKCEYRTKSGLRCAAGCLMNKKQYTNLKRKIDNAKTHDMSSIWTLEGTSWNALVAHKHVPSYNVVIISALQHLHDSTAPHQWFNELNIFGKNYSLDTAFLEQYYD